MKLILLHKPVIVTMAKYRPKRKSWEDWQVKARSHGGHSDAISPNYFCSPQSLLCPENALLKHIIKTRIYPPTNLFIPPLNLKTWLREWQSPVKMRLGWAVPQKHTSRLVPTSSTSGSATFISLLSTPKRRNFLARCGSQKKNMWSNIG